MEPMIYRFFSAPQLIEDLLRTTGFDVLDWLLRLPGSFVAIGLDHDGYILRV
ncbi:hypothetical protein [Corynebacterium amycolatum]|uniref:hypothetical protein n=1 Tax=Corynebacterium amycolatum TaxID=43765 RepID=UPI003AF966AB